jgi:tetratricopeptide (TPR) repeat protein
MPRLSMWFLGGHRVSLDQEPSRELEYDKVRALLAYLAIEAGRPHRREALAGLLWPDLPERQALAFSQEHGFDRVTAFCLLGEGHMAYERGAYAEARPPLQAAQALFQSASSQGVPFAQSLLGDVAFAEEKYEEAESHYCTVLSTCKHLGLAWVEPLAGDCLGTGPTLNRLGDVALARGNMEQARSRYRETLALAAQEPYLGLKLDALARQAVLLSQEGHAEHAAEFAALVAAHPACANPTRKVLDVLRPQLQQALPPDSYAAAIVRGETLDIDASLRERLAQP